MQLLRFWFYLTEEILEKSLNLALILFFALYARFACVIIRKIIRNVCILCMIVTSFTDACYAEIANIFGAKTNVIFYQEAFMDSREYLIELRTSTGMTRKEFCEYFEIPYRTLQDWELGNRKMPDYLLRLMAYKAKMEKLGEEKKNQQNNI